MFFGNLTKAAEAGGGSEGFTEESGFTVTGTFSHGETATITGTGFGTKSRGGPALLYDFGDELYINGVLDNFNAGLIEGDSVYGTDNTGETNQSPAYFNVGGLSAQRFPVWERNNHLRHARIAGHYRGPDRGEGRTVETSHFNGVVPASDGSKSSPSALQDNRYYFSFRSKYPDGRDGTASLKTIRASQNDDNNNGIVVTQAGHISKWFLKVEENGETLAGGSSSFATEPFHNTTPSPYDKWHLEELFVDPTGTLNTGDVTIFTRWYFEDVAPENYFPNQPDWDFPPTSDWDSNFGLYHQIGPESSASFDESIDQNCRFGEGYFDDSFRRIVISDSDSLDTLPYDGTGVAVAIELQRITSWSDTEIDIVINQGALASLSGKYLYWYDNDNDPHLIGQFD